jgi:uncharacterized protein YbjT (DUF2867 family)
MSKIVLVTGATGAQGGSVVDALLQDGKWKVRGLTRDPTSAKAKALADKGVEVVKGDLNNKEELTNALQGVYGVFAVTNFWDPDIFPNNIHREEQQGKQLADIAKQQGIKHFLWSSLHDTKAVSGGKLEVPHFSGKNHVEKYIQQIGLPATYVYPGFYFSNIGLLGKADEQGNVTLALSVNPDTKVPIFDATNDTGKFVVEILNNPDKFLGKKVHMATEYITFPQLVESLSKATGKKYSFYPATRETLAGYGVPEEFLIMFDWFREYGYYNGEDISENVKTFKGLTTLEDYAQRLVQKQ